MSVFNVFDKEKICTLTKIPTQNIIVLDIVDSTNTYLKDLAMSAAYHETVVFAGSQTNGRGRCGKTFFSPANTGIYMSILLATDKILLDESYITIAAGVAVCRALKSIGCNQPLIKWVNDVFVNGKKVCGILAEKVSNKNYIVVGIGININTPHDGFPDAIKKTAGAVSSETISYNETVSDILNEFKQICSSNDLVSLIDEYKRYSLILGKKISFLRNGTVFNGIATDIDLNGNLIVSLDCGESLILNSGEISLGSQNFSV